MGHIENNEQKKIQKNTFTDSLKNEWEVIGDVKSVKKEPAEKVPERVNAATAIKSQDYLERMIENSKDANLALKIKQEETLEAGNWANMEYAKGYPVQKLPVAVKDRKWGSSENDAVKEAKKTFRNADLCTVREKFRMSEYFKNWKNGNAPEPEGEDDPSNEALNKYVSDILKVELGEAHFTDDYLSQHIEELYDYSVKLTQYSGLKEKYPKYFDNLPLEKQIELEEASKMGTKLKDLLTEHMKLHGVVIEESENGVKVSLRTEPKDKTERHLQRAKDKGDYQSNLARFYNRNVINKELLKGARLSAEGVFDSNKTIAALEEKVNARPELKELYGSEIDAVMEEVKKSLAVREELLERQRGFCSEYRKTKDTKTRKNLELSIKRMNSRVLLASKHVDNYRSFISFLTGEVKRLPAETAEFFLAEKHTDLVEIIDFKMSADFVNDSLVLEKISGKEKNLKSLKEQLRKAKQAGTKEKGKKSKKGAAKADTSKLEEEIAKLEAEIKKDAVYEEHSIADYSKEFRRYRKESERNKAVEIKNGEIREKKEAAMKEGDTLAKEYGLVRREDRIFGCLNGTFKDIGKEGDGGDLTYMYMACAYKPGPETSTEMKNLIIEKGVKPILNRILSINGDKLNAMDLKGEPDLNSPEFWDNKALLAIGFVKSFFLGILNNYDVSLKDEEYDHIIAFSKVSEELYGKYNNVGGQDPRMILLKDEKISSEKMFSLVGNVYGDYLQLNKADLTPETKKVLARYSRKSLGFGTRSRGLSGREVTVDIPEAIANLSQLVAGEQIHADKDYKAEYDKELEIIKKSGGDAEEREEERKEMLSYFPGYGDKELNIRLGLKSFNKSLDRRVTKEQAQKWKKALGSDSDLGTDLRSFKLFLRPIKTDKNGTTHPDSVKDREFNAGMIDDYISGDEKRRNKVLFRIAKEFLDVKVTPEMISFDYMKEHYLELHDLLEKVHGFQNILSEFPDFFESDVFTEEEKDHLRQTFVDSETLSTLSATMAMYVRVYGLTDAGKSLEISPEDRKTKESRAAWGAKQITMMERMARMQFEDETIGVKAQYEKDMKRKALYETKGNEIRKVSALYAKLKAERVALKRSKDPDKERLEEFDKELKLAAELKAYIYGDKESVSAEARLLSYNHDIGLFSNEEINDARVDLDMSYDMELDEVDSIEVNGQKSMVEKEEEAERREKAREQRAKWEQELRKEKLEAHRTGFKDQGISVEEFKEQNDIISESEKEKKIKEKQAKEKAAEEERLAKEKAAEEERLAKEKKTEEERLKKEKEEEKERLEKEKKAEEEKRANERYEIEHTDASKLKGAALDSYRRRETAEAEKLYNEAMKKREEEGNLDSDEPLFIFNGKKYINQNATSFITEWGENAEINTKKHLPKDYPENTRAEMEQILKDKGYAIPEDKDDMSDIMNDHCEIVYWLENGQLRNESIWKKDVPVEIRQAYNWLRGYHRAYDMGVRIDEGEIPVLEMPSYKVKVKFNKSLMEKQGPNNCWCCAGAAIYNQMFINKAAKEAHKKGLKKLTVDKNDLADQYDIRGYEPDYKDYDELNAKFKGKVDKTLFNFHKAKTDEYAGEGKDRIGNIFEMSDFFLDKAKEHDFILNRMIFNIPSMDDSANVEKNFKIYNNMKVNFLNQVKEVLDTNNVVACLSHNSAGGAHYRTITGINGENITYYDSGSGTEETGSWETFLNTTSHIPTELTWFSPMKKPEELTAEYSNLTYSKEKGFDVKRFRAESALNVAQTKGVCVGADVRKMKAGTDGIEKAIYIPKNV